MTARRNLIAFSFCVIYIIYGIFVIKGQSFFALNHRRYFTVADDALITLRYGWNLAHGKGLVWNEGEYVEGTTSILWSVYAAGLSLALDKRFLPLGIQLSAIVFMIITALGFRCIARSYIERSGSPTHFDIFELAAALLPLSYFPFVYWSIKGMETSLQGALTAAALCIFFTNRTRPSLPGSTLLGLAYLTRPDTIIPSAMILLFRGIARIRKEHGVTDTLKEALPLIGIFSAAMIFRYLYYGSLVPNTYILKVSGLSLIERITLNGIGYITPLLKISWPVLALLMISILLRPTVEKSILAAMIASMLVYTVCVGGDAFPYWRFLAVYMPYAFLGVLIDIPKVVQLVQGILKNRFIKSITTTLLTTISIILLFIISRPDPYNRYLITFRYPQDDDMANINTSLYLSDVLKPTASVGVFYAGAIPFYTGLNAVDFLGKSDPYIASLPPDISGTFAWGGLTSAPGHNKYDLKYSILEKHPTYIAGLMWGKQDITQEGLTHYVRIPVDFFTWSDDRQSVLLLKDSNDVEWDEVSHWSIKHLKQ